MLTAALLCSAPNFSTMAHAAEAQAAAIPTGARDLSGVWWTRSYNPRILPARGASPPFTPVGAARYADNVAKLRDGSLEDHSRVWCSPDGLPRAWSAPYPFRIVQTANEAAIIYENNGEFRLIEMDKDVPPESDWLPYFMGNSYGKWDGNTLVVNVVGFKATTTFLDDSGVPHSDRLRLTERLRKIGEDQLEVVVTIDDSVMFTETWDARFVFQHRDDIKHFDFWVCGEPHRDIRQVQGAPR